MKKLLANPKARIAALAALVAGGLYLFLRNRQPAAGATFPVAPNAPADQGGATASPIDLGAGLGGSLGSTFVDPQVAGGELFPDNKLREAAMQLIDQIRGISEDVTAASSFAGGADGGGASNPTGGRTAGGDGSAPVPGNAFATRRLRGFTGPPRGRIRQRQLGDIGVSVASGNATARHVFRRTFLPGTPGRNASGAPQAPHANVIRVATPVQPGHVAVPNVNGISPAAVAPRQPSPALAAPIGRATPISTVTPSGAFVITQPTAVRVSTPSSPVSPALRAQPWQAPALKPSSPRTRVVAR